MYLFVYADRSVSQVNDNLTICDILAVKEKILDIYAVKDDVFVKVIIIKNEVCFEPVKQASILQNKDGRLHHP